MAELQTVHSNGGPSAGLKALLGKACSNVVVRVGFDAQAAVWFALGVNLPGLIVEADSLDELRSLLSDLIPEVIGMNGPPKALPDALAEASSDYWVVPVKQQ